VRTIGLVLHPTRTDTDSLRLMQANITSMGARFVGRDIDARRLPTGVEPVPDTRFRAEVDAVVSLGGDGTMLGAMRLVANRPVPVLGVNAGHLGFLVETQPANLPAALERVRSADYTIEEHYGLRLESPHGCSMAFNDVVLARQRGSAVNADLEIAGARYGYYRCDAVVVATPHGSTAYSFAAGGPVVSPQAGVLVVTPVAPMSGIGRPVVLGGSESLRLVVDRHGPSVAVEIDGTDGGLLTADESISVTLIPGAGQVVRLEPEAYAARNRVKLSLLDLPLRPDQLLELVPPELRESRGGPPD
jgi:NAD+ kinase